MGRRLLFLVMIAVASHVLATPIDDFELVVRESEAYKSFTSDCERCPIAGAKGTGCWGNIGPSAVRQSLCKDKVCFCNPDKMAENAKYIYDFAMAACKMESSAQIARDGYTEYCGAAEGNTTQTVSPTSSPTSDPTTLPTHSAPPLGPAEIASIVVPVIGVVVAIITAIWAPATVLRFITCGCRSPNKSNRDMRMRMVGGKKQGAES
ncbi:hypothetical protein LMH87_001383 [Akanthomyces muscarius]|uniref:Extracellular membrane protein CFEM domain-containing protein n=1 Tax=Akanthomyces muscarius TaxID=2231603 RepID=A0A9W8Q5K3_AKAMU|nr:hypothetical protein LMH87_001383 [Akanthomyces muscarius]KAJ4146824.1 hypothetical protein LMH87_001383 [Akanthomyces muscarius]